jgi:hypothetical protein
MKLPLKPGVTTTEFWTTVGAGLILTALSAMSLLEATWTAVGITLLTLAYNGARGRIKKLAIERESKPDGGREVLAMDKDIDIDTDRH